MGGESRTFSTLLDFLESAITRFPDVRTGRNVHYRLRDGVLSAFSVFFLQCPSFLAHQILMQQKRGKNNAHTLFGVEGIPTDAQIRNLLDPIAPELCFEVFSMVVQLLQQRGTLKEQFFSIPLDSYLMALDGTWFHKSEEIFCAKCLHQDHRDGRQVYFHSAITPIFVRPGSNHVIAVEPQFIEAQDGQEKQDCERNAAKRWISGAGKRYAPMGITLLADDLYCNDAFCREVLEAGFHFLFTCKSSSHPHLATWIEDAEVGTDITEVLRKQWTGKRRLTYRYRFMNDVPLRNEPKALRVNWCELAILEQDGTVQHRFGFAGDHRLTRQNIVEVVEAGRSRWKIENEHNNTLKTKGYNLEHNFGHGRKHLANLLLTLNLLAFLFHTVLELFDNRYALLRKSLRRRQTFFEDLRSITRYWCFDGWDELMRFMLRGLELPDPGG